MLRKLICTLLFIAPLTVFAQQAEGLDEIFTNNGKNNLGSVTRMDGDNVYFIYKGEKLEYAVSKKDIAKIRFASGREETFSLKAGAGDFKKNSIAVLPFKILSNTSENNEDLAKSIQSDYYRTASAKPGVYEYQDITVTNVLLRKKGITTAQIGDYTPDELCGILGVEYVVIGSVSRTRTGTEHSSSSGTTETVKWSDDGDKVRDNTFSTSSGSSKDKYEAEVGIVIYSNEMKKVYDKKRSPMFNSGHDDYKATVQYLAKRTPFYFKD